MKKRDNNAFISVEAEQAVLGGLMLDAGAWLGVADILQVEHFGRPDHQLIFGAIAALAGERKPTDPVTVAELLDRRGKNREAGGLQYLGTLTRDTPGAANVRAYAEAVHGRWKIRQAAKVGDDLRQGSDDGDDMVDNAIQRLMALAHRRSDNDGLLGDGVSAFIDDLDEMYTSGSRPPGVMTGLKRLDDKLGGFLSLIHI